MTDRDPITQAALAAARDEGRIEGAAVGADDLTAAYESGMERAAGIADDFSWVLPLYKNRKLDEASDDAACAVSNQIAAAIRADKGDAAIARGDKEASELEQSLWAVIDDGTPPGVPSEIIGAVERIKAYSARLTSELEQAKALLGEWLAVPVRSQVHASLSERARAFMGEG